LDSLDEEEKALVADLLNRARRDPDWNAFDNYSFAAVAQLYDGRGVLRTESRKTIVYRIAQDLSSRLGIAAGLIRVPDYRDDLAELIKRRFKTQRAFCEATGLTEDMLSHVLARRKHLSMETLTQALEKIGCKLRILPRNGDDALNGSAQAEPAAAKPG
jgi:hypothetical protein